MIRMEDVLARLRKVKQRDRGRQTYWQACCPIHKGGAERWPSLSLWVASDNQYIRAKCFACGANTRDVLNALGWQSMDSTPMNRVVKTYVYEDEECRPLYRVCRTEPKGFFQERHDAATDSFTPGMDGVRRVLYRLPALLREPKRLAWIVEGEKDADALAELGFLATTNVGGAGKWRDEYSKLFYQRQVVLVPDHDEAGQAHARQVAGSLLQYEVASIRWLYWASGQKDVSEVIAESRRIKVDPAIELRACVACAAEYRMASKPLPCPVVRSRIEREAA